VRAAVCRGGYGAAWLQPRSHKAFADSPAGKDDRFFGLTNAIPPPTDPQIMIFRIQCPSQASKLLNKMPGKLDRRDPLGALSEEYCQ